MVQVPEILFRYHINEIARICRVSLKTAQRWKTGQVGIPHTAIMVLSRDVGCFHPEWSGWVISARGELCSPENWITTTGAVLAMHFHRSQLSALREEILILKKQLKGEELDQYEEQPLPEQWEYAVR